MLDFDKMILRERKWMLYLLAIFVLGIGFTPYTRVFNGLLLGGAVSFYNLWLLQRKTKVLTESVASTGKAKGGLGTFSRFAAVILAVLIAIRFPSTFQIISVVAGIVSSYVIIVADVFLRLLSDRKQKNS